MELQNAVSRSLGVALPATVAFDYPTIAALAAYIATRRQPHTQGDAPARQASVADLIALFAALHLLNDNKTLRLGIWI